MQKPIVLGCVVAFLLSLGPSLAQQVAIGEYSLPTTDSFPYAITAGPDGALWFAANAYIGRISTAGSITQYPQEGEPKQIVFGSDGGLWFTLSSGNRIGHMTRDGNLIATYPVLSRDSYPWGLTFGPDGALWFTEYQSHTGNKIGRMTTEGVCSEYPIAEANAGPTGITAGPDGALWFTEYAGDIGRVTIAGVISYYSVPTANSQPSWITIGPDGALWFTESGGNKIGRITTAGAITEFPVLTAASQPTGLTVGPDGALWFTEAGANQIGRITTAGTVTEYAMPAAGSRPLLITAGSDGALWFTDPSGNNIGEAVLVTAGLSVTPTNGFFHAGLVFTGSGYAPGENVQIYAEGVGSAVLAGATVDSTGAFTATGQAPQSPYGPRMFLGTGQSSGKLGAASFSVTPRLIVDPNSGTPGSTTAVSGYGYAPFETVDVYWDNPVFFLGTAPADVQGSFRASAALTITVPDQAVPGVDVVSGAGQKSGAKGGGHFTVE